MKMASIVVEIFIRFKLWIIAKIEIIGISTGSEDLLVLRS
jgi:hypothetical protein